MQNPWLPDDARMEDQVDRLVAVHMAQAGWLEDELRKLDPMLRVVLAKENAQDHRLKPGFWHVMRLNPKPVPISAWILTRDEKGRPTLVTNASLADTYCEPGSWVMDAMKKLDTWNRSVAEKLDILGERENERRRREQELERLQRRDQIREDWRAMKRVSGDGGLRARKWAKGVVGS